MEILSIRFQQNVPGSIGEHIHAYYELHYIPAGDGIYLCDKKQYSIKSGALILSLPGTKHLLFPKIPKEPLSQYLLSFRPEGPLMSASNSNQMSVEKKLFSKIDQYFLKSPLVYVGKAPLLFFEKCRQLHQLSGLEKEIVKIHLISFLSDIVLKPISISDNNFIQTALLLMQKNISRPYSVEEYAKAMSVSPSWFIRVFKKEMGCTPLTYFNELKIEIATNILLTSVLKNREISEHLGFYDEYHFSKVFKKVKGLSPQNWRERNGV